MTGRPCKVCNHPMRKRIERAAVLKEMTQAEIAGRWEVGHPDALRRHLANHVTEEQRRAILLEAKVEAEQQVANNLNEERLDISTGLQRIVGEIDAILQKAKANGNDPMALLSLKEMRQTLLALAKLHGQLNQELTVTVNLNESPQFLTLREIILRVLERHPGAKADFLGEMKRLQVADG